MSDTRLPASGNIRIYFAPLNSIANYLAPTTTELNAAGVVDLTDAISWNDYNHLLQASNTIDDPALSAIGKASDLGALQFGGQLSFYYPKSFADTTNRYKTVYDLLYAPRTQGYLVVRVDGKHSADTVTNGEQTIAAGDVVQVYKVITDGFNESVTGEDAFRYTINFQPQGYAAPRVIVQNGATAPATSIITNDAAITTLSKTVAGGKFKLDAKVDGRYQTTNVTWTSSDVAKATVSSAGVVTPIAVTGGTPVNITATYYGGRGNTVAVGTTTACALTLT
jgi:hypothetical protein